MSVDSGGIVIVPVECPECGSIVYVKPERLENDDPLTCNEHS